MHRRPSLRSWSSAAAFVLGSMLLCAADPAAPPPEEPAREEHVASRVGTSGPAIDRKAYVGADRCAECHQAEYLIWAASDHATCAFDLLRTSPNAKKYAVNLGMDAESVVRSRRCLACHSTPHDRVALRSGAFTGVTCEACHNAAGGEDGWLNVHAVYGPSGTRREEETANHRNNRIAACRAAGQIRCDDLYHLAKRCYGCHVVSDEELIVRGGHKSGNPGFEMVERFSGTIRHNLFLDPQVNASVSSLWADPLWRKGQRSGRAQNRRRVMYVVALLVDLELSLRNRGRAEHVSFATAAATRIAAAQARLQVVADSDASGELTTAMEAVGRLKSKLFLEPTNDDFEAFHKAATVVAQTALRIASADDGERFSAVDPFLPTDAEQALGTGAPR